MRAIVLRVIGTAFLTLLSELILPRSKVSETAMRAIALICTAFVLEPIVVLLGGL